MKISHLTPGEELLMNVLWRLDSGYMREIIEQYPDPKPHPNTISTFLKILVEKEFLTTQKEGRIFKYTVAIPFDYYRKYSLHIFLQEYFNNAAPELVKVLIDEQLLRADDLQHFFEMKSTEIPIQEKEEDSDLTDFINDITSPKKKKKKKKKEKGEKNKKKNK